MKEREVSTSERETKKYPETALPETPLWAKESYGESAFEHMQFSVL